MLRNVHQHYRGGLYSTGTGNARTTRFLVNPYKFDEGFPPGHSRQSAGQLKIEEKFDSYLDLKDICDWTTACRERQIIVTEREFTGLRMKPDMYKRQLDAAGINMDIVNRAYITSYTPALILRYALNSNDPITNIQPKMWHEFITQTKRASILSIQTQLEHFLTSFSPTLREYHREVLNTPVEKFNNSPAIIKLFQCIRIDMYRILAAFKSCMGDKIIDTIDDERVENVHGYIIKCRSLGNCIVRVTSFVTIIQAADITLALNSKLLLLTINKMIEFGNLCTYFHFSSGSSLPVNCLNNYLNWSRCICAIFHHKFKRGFQYSDVAKEQDAFCLTKAMEALGVSILIRRNDWVANWDNSRLMDVTWAALLEEAVIRTPVFQDHPLGKIMTGLSDEEITEFIGTVKVFGHPTINIEEGLKKLKERVHDNVSINPRTVSQVSQQLKRDLFFGFYRVNKKYPNHTFRPDCSQELRKILLLNQDPSHTYTNKRWRSIPLSEWENVEIEKTEEFEIIDNQITTIKDKALGLTRDKVYLLLLQDINDDQRSARQREESKALLAYLLEPYFDVVFQRYMSEYIGKNWEEWSRVVLNYLVIKLTPKELELKQEGRMFGASPSPERSRRINQEWISMKMMDKYFPDQMLTPDELTTIKRLYSFRALRRLHPNQLVLQVSFDFSRWNNNFRHESIDVVAEQILDKFYGVKLWSKTMRAFQQMLVYYHDKYRSEKWEGQDGGIEGLNQATWSLVFLAGIKYALSQTAKVFQVTVKGDDVRAAIVIPGDPKKMTAQSLQDHRDKILENMRSFCAELGWKLNPHECFVSLSLIASSKQYQVHECWLPSSGKKMLKIESLTNTIFPTVEDVISTIFSNCHSACSQTTNILPAFSTATFVAARTLLHELLTLGDTISEYQLSMLLMWPQILGGPGSLPLQVFFIRGENDMLSISISLLRFILNNSIGQLKSLAERILRQGWKHPIPKQLLISDPYGLPLDCPDRPDQLLKRQLKSTMKFWVKNKKLLPLLSLDTERDSENFQKLLLSMRPYCAKIATALWECSVFFLKEEILAKFSNSSTVFQFLTRTSNTTGSVKNAYSILRSMIKQSLIRKRYWLQQLKGRSILTSQLLGVSMAIWTDPIICSTQITHMVRESAWGFEIVGLTYPSSVDQVKLIHSQDYIHFGLGFTEKANAKHEVRLADAKYQTTVDPSHHYSAVSTITPWLGSKTTPSAMIKGFEEGSSSPTMAKIKRLIVIAQNRGTLGDDLYHICQALTRAVTDIDLSDVLSIAAVTGGGHVAHRVPINAFSLVTMPNHRPNRSQLVYHMTDQMQFVENDSHRRTVNYACYRYMATVLCTFELEYSRKLTGDTNLLYRSTLHWDLSDDTIFNLCPWCNNIVDDPVLQFDTSLIPDLSKYKNICMIGCSDVEETMLTSNIQRAAIEKVRRFIKSEQLDVSDPIVMTAASLIYLNNLSAEGRVMSSIRNTLELKFISDPYLLPSLAAITGNNDIALYDPSDLMIRTIPPDILYDSIKQHTFFSINYEILIVLWSPNPLAQLNWNTIYAKLYRIFEKVLDSGAIYTLISGYKKCMEVCEPHERVSLYFSVQQSANVRDCIRKFVTAHIPVYTNWLLRGDIPHRYKPFVHLESAEAISQKFDELYHNFMRLLAYKIEYNKHKDGALMWIMEVIRDIMQHHELDLPDLIRSDITWEEVSCDSGVQILVRELARITAPTMIRPLRGAKGRSIEMFIHVWLIITLPVIYRPLALTRDSDDLYDTTTDMQLFERIDDNIGRDHGLPLDHLIESVPYFMDLFNIHTDNTMNLILNTVRFTVEWLEDLAFEPWGMFFDWKLRVMNVLDSYSYYERMYRQVRVTCMSKLDVKRVLKDRGDLVRQCDALLKSLADANDWKEKQMDQHLIHSWCDTPSHVNITPLYVSVTPTDNAVLISNLISLIENLNALKKLSRNLNKTLLTPSCRHYIYGYQNFTGARFLYHTRSYNLWNLLRSQQDNIFMTTIGDGTGSMSLVLMLQSRRIKNYYCTLQTEMNTVERKKDNHPLQAPLGLINAERDLSDQLTWFGNFPGDFTRDEVYASVLHSVQTQSLGNDIIIFEAEFPNGCPEDYIIECYDNLCKLVLSTLKMNGIVVIKVQFLYHALTIRWMYILLILFGDHHILYCPNSIKTLRYVTFVGSILNTSVTHDIIRSWLVSLDRLPYHAYASCFIEEFFHDFSFCFRSNISCMRPVNLHLRSYGRIPRLIITPICPLELLLGRLFQDFSYPQLSLDNLVNYIIRYCGAIVSKIRGDVLQEPQDIITGLSLANYSLERIPRVILSASCLITILPNVITHSNTSLSDMVMEGMLRGTGMGLSMILSQMISGAKYTLEFKDSKWYLIGIKSTTPDDITRSRPSQYNDMTHIYQEVFNIILRLINWIHTLLEKFKDDSNGVHNNTLVPDLILPPENIDVDMIISWLNTGYYLYRNYELEVSPEFHWHINCSRDEEVGADVVEGYEDYKIRQDHLTMIALHHIVAPIYKGALDKVMTVMGSQRFLNRSMWMSPYYYDNPSIGTVMGLLDKIPRSL